MAFDFSGVAAGIKAAAGAVAPELIPIIEGLEKLGKVFATVEKAIHEILKPFDSLLTSLKDLTASVIKLIASAVAPLVAVLKPAFDALSVAINVIIVPIKLAAATFQTIAQAINLLFTPFKLLTDAFNIVAKIVIDVLLVPLKLISIVFQAMETAANALLTPLKLVAVAFELLDAALSTLSDVVTDPIEAIGNLAGKIRGLADAGARLLAIPFDQISAGISSVQSQIAGFVQKLNPGYLIRWNLAVDDLQATIGRALLPLLEQATAAVRQIGSVINGLNGSGQDAIRAFAGGIVALKGIAAGAAAVVTVLTGGLAPALAAIVGGTIGLASTSEAAKKVFDRITLVIGGTTEQIGEALRKLEPVAAPVLRFLQKSVEEASALINRWAGLIGDLAPEFEKISLAFEEVGRAIGDAIKPLIGVLVGALAGGLKFLAEAAAGAAPYVIALVDAIKKGFLAIGRLVNDFLGLFGFKITAPGFGEVSESQKKDNTGAAAKATSIGSTDEYIRKALASAYSLGGPAKSNISEQTLTATNDLAKQASIFNQKFEIVAKSVSEIANFLLHPTDVAKNAIEEGKSVGNYIINNPGEAAREAASGLKIPSFSDLGGAAVGAVRGLFG